MRLLFKQRMFSWFDSYDIYDENGNRAFIVEGKPSWGHCLHIIDSYNRHIGTIKEKIFTFMPKFELYDGVNYVGEVKKEFTFLRPRYNLDCKGWHIEGDILGWNYRVLDSYGHFIMSAEKQFLKWTDTYIIDIMDTNDILCSLMVVLAIDAANCSNG